MFVTPKVKPFMEGGHHARYIYSIDTNNYHNIIKKANRKDLVRSFAEYTNNHRVELGTPEILCSSLKLMPTFNALLNIAEAV